MVGNVVDGVTCNLEAEVEERSRRFVAELTLAMRTTPSVGRVLSSHLCLLWRRKSQRLKLLRKLLFMQMAGSC